MSRRSNPTWIGAFVVGAAALLVIAVLVVGSGRLFKRSYHVISYFEGSVDGLNVGAPVKVKGVEVGSVERILLRFDQSADSNRIPVFIEVDADRMASYGVGGALDRKRVEDAVQRGLRARLQSESLLTGLLEVQLDFYPESEAVFVGGGKIQEIPTVPTSTAELQTALKDVIAKLKRTDIPGLVSHATTTADAVRELAGGLETKKAMISLDRALTDMSALTAEVRRKLDPIAGSLVETSKGAKRSFDDAGATARQIRALLEADSPVTVALVQALREVGAAAHSVRLVADELERDPSMLVRGKNVEESRR